jgi:hypothetical protein
MLHVIAITLVAFGMAPAVAHALELPGKVRLPKEAYVTVQQIYYPGFTIAGVGEFAAFIAVALLLWSTPRGTAAFWLALGALLGVLAMQAVAAGKNFKRGRLSVFLIRSHKSQTGSVEAAVRLDPSP